MNKYPGSSKGPAVGGNRTINQRARILATKVAAPRPVNLPSLRRENAGAETPPPPPTAISAGWGSPQSLSSSPKQTVDPPRPSIAAAEEKVIEKPKETLPPPPPTPPTPPTEVYQVKTEPITTSTHDWAEMVEEDEIAERNSHQAQLHENEAVSPSDRFTEDYDRSYPPQLKQIREPVEDTHRPEQPKSHQIWRRGEEAHWERDREREHERLSDRQDGRSFREPPERRGPTDNAWHKRDYHRQDTGKGRGRFERGQGEGFQPMLLQRPRDEHELPHREIEPDILPGQRTVMLTAAERAKKRRDEEEAAFEAVRERARQKALALAPRVSEVLAVDTTHSAAAAVALTKDVPIKDVPTKDVLTKDVPIKTILTSEIISDTTAPQKVAHPKPTPDTSMANTPITTTSDSGNPVTISETNTSPVVEIKSHTLEHTTQPASVIDMTADDKEWEKFVKTRVSDKAEQVSAISTPSDWHSYSDRLQKMTEDSSSKMKLLSTQKSNRTTMNTVEVYDYQKEAHLQAHWGTEEHTTEEAYTVWGGPTEGGRGHVRHNEKGWRESTERQVPLGPGRSKYFEGGRNKSIDKGWTEPNDGRRSRPIEGRPTDPQTEEKVETSEAVPSVSAVSDESVKAEETLKEQLWSEQTEPVHDEKSEEGWGAPSTSDASVKPEEDWKERIEMQEGWPTTTDPQKPIGWGKDKNFERGHSHGQGRGRGAERGAERGADRGTRRGAGTSAGAPHEGSKRPEYTAQETRSSGSWRKRPAKEEQGPSDIAPSLTVKTQPSSYSSASPDSPVTSVPKTPKPQASSRPPIFPESIRRLNGKKPASLSFMVTTDESDYDITMMDALAHTPMGTLPSHTSTVSEKDQETSCSKESSHGVDELTETLEQPKAEINKYTQRSLPNTHSHNSHHSHNHNYNHNSHSYSQSHSYNSTTPTTPTSHNIAPPIMIPHTSSHPVFVYPLPRFAPREQQDQRPMSNRPHPSHGYSNNHQHRPMNIYMMPPQQPMPYTQQGYPWPHRGVRHNK